MTVPAMFVQAARIGTRENLTRRCFLPQAAEYIYHCLRSVSVVMDNLPSSGFSTIDVRDAAVAGHRLSSKLKLPMLDTQFVGHIPGDLNELIAQVNLPLRG